MSEEKKEDQAAGTAPDLEAIRAEKIRKFNENPDDFFSQEDIVVAVVKDHRGTAVVCGSHPRYVVEMALTRLNHRVFSMFTEMDFANAMRESGNKKIITPQKPSGIMSFVRGKH